MNEAEIVDKIGRWLRQPDAQLFMEKVEERTRTAMSTLRNSTDLHGVGQAQGQLKILDWILRLRREESE